MGIFSEGIGAISQACTLALLLPACAVVLAAGRYSLAAFAGFAAGATVIAWARFTDNWFATPSGLLAVLVGLATLAAVVTLWRFGSPALGGPAAMVVGAATGWLWEPCVGTELAVIINEGPDAALSTLWGTFLYVFGALLVALALATLRYAFPRVAEITTSTMAVGAVLGTIVAITMAIGAYDDVVSELVLRSRP